MSIALCRRAPILSAKKQVTISLATNDIPVASIYSPKKSLRKRNELAFRRGDGSDNHGVEGGKFERVLKKGLGKLGLLRMIKYIGIDSVCTYPGNALRSEQSFRLITRVVLETFLRLKTPRRF
jgi:hypothetical protein